jgi:ABC-2 type transport system ATP-binding protein
MVSPMRPPIEQNGSEIRIIVGEGIRGFPETHHSWAWRCPGRRKAKHDPDCRVDTILRFVSRCAGKTTTIRMLVGLLRPTSGTAIVSGYDVQREPVAAKRAIGYLAQAPLLYERLTGREFLRFVGGLYGLEDGVVDARAEELLALLELADKADQLIESYSGGMRHKIGLCGALIHGPPVLILDEPLAGLDPYSARRVKDMLRELCRRGRTVFMSTHVLEIAERVCDRVGILDHGHLIAMGTIEALRTQAASSTGATLEDLFLRLTGGDAVSAVATMLE